MLGKPAYSVHGEVPDELDAGFYYAKVEVADAVRVRRLCGLGFAPVDVNVTLSRRGDAAAPSDIDVRPVAAGEHDALLEIAGSCFRYSRFHLDPAIPNEDADRVKREWVRSYLERRRGLELLAAVEGGRPTGFLAVLEAGDVRVIDLVGVAPEAQRRGIGAGLVAAFIERHGAHAREVRVGTQLANIPSLRLYEKLGFHVVAGAYVLHRHV